MRRIDDIREAIRAGYGEDEVAQACQRVLAYIEAHPEDSKSEITFSQFSRASGIPAEDPRFFAVVSVLTTRFPVLHWKFVYFDDHGSPYFLDEAEASEFVNSGEFIDPRSDEYIESAGSKIVPYFSADAGLLEMAGQ